MFVNLVDDSFRWYLQIVLKFLGALDMYMFHCGNQDAKLLTLKLKKVKSEFCLFRFILDVIFLHSFSSSPKFLIQ